MITIKNLSYAYKASQTVLHNINCNLQAGKIYGLLGLNGEGKSTLLRLIVGMLIPKYGEIQVNNLLSYSRSQSFFDQVFYLADSSKLPNLKIEEFGKLYGAFYSRFNLDQFLDNVKQFNIPTEIKLKAMSLGQHRKVHISFALACNCDVLLMDEPTNGLDIPSKSIFRKLLAQYISDDKIFIIATHQIKDVDKLLDHLLILKNGSLVVDDSLLNLASRYIIKKEISADKQFIYKQDELAYPLYLIENKENIESELDIEFLFNAFTQNNLIEQ